jgi:hypothetical protein
VLDRVFGAARTMDCSGCVMKQNFFFPAKTFSFGILQDLFFFTQNKTQRGRKKMACILEMVKSPCAEVQAEGLRRLLSPKDCWENRSIVSISPEMFLAAFQSSLDTVVPLCQARPDVLGPFLVICEKWLSCSGRSFKDLWWCIRTGLHAPCGQTQAVALMALRRFFYRTSDIPQDLPTIMKVIVHEESVPRARRSAHEAKSLLGIYKRLRVGEPLADVYGFALSKEWLGDVVDVCLHMHLGATPVVNSLLRWGFRAVEGQGTLGRFLLQKRWRETVPGEFWVRFFGAGGPGVYVALKRAGLWDEQDRLADVCEQLLARSPPPVLQAWMTGCVRHASWLGEKVLLLHVWKQRHMAPEVVAQCLRVVVNNINTSYDIAPENSDRGWAVVGCVAVKKTWRRCLTHPEYIKVALIVLGRAVFLCHDIFQHCPSVIPFVKQALASSEIYGGTILCARNGLVSLRGSEHLSDFLDMVYDFVMSLAADKFARVRHSHCKSELHNLLYLILNLNDIVSGNIHLLYDLLKNVPPDNDRDALAACDVLAIWLNAVLSTKNVDCVHEHVPLIIGAFAHAFCPVLFMHRGHLSENSHAHRLLGTLSSLFWHVAVEGKEECCWRWALSLDMFVSPVNHQRNVEVWNLLNLLALAFEKSPLDFKYELWAKWLLPSLSCKPLLWVTPMSPEHAADLQHHLVQVQQRYTNLRAAWIAAVVWC